MPFLSINNLSKSFGSLEVFKDMNITVQKGEFVSIIGPSGCGKSTVFNILAGIKSQSSGEIYLNGKSFHKRTGNFGYMLQSPLLLPWRTVLENILLGLDIAHVERKVSLAKANSLLQTFGLSDFANVYPATLSGGMKQRVALLRTFLFNSNFLLLDEPFGALDSLTRFSCQKWLLQVLKKFHATVLFITHDVDEAILLSDRMYVMSPRPGKIVGEFLVNKKSTQLKGELLQLLFQKTNNADF